MRFRRAAPQRLAAEKLLAHAAPKTRKPSQADIDAIRDGLYASKIVAYAQGFEEMAAASQEYGWNLKLGELAMIWRGGCIIRARLLHRITEAYEKDAAAPNLLLQPFFRDAVGEGRAELAEDGGACGRERRSDPGVLIVACLLRRNAARRAGPANLLQGLRDYFGAHTYRRLDKPGVFHTRWSQDGSEATIAPGGGAEA